MGIKNMELEGKGPWKDRYLTEEMVRDFLNRKVRLKKWAREGQMDHCRELVVVGLHPNNSMAMFAGAAVVRNPQDSRCSIQLLCPRESSYVYFREEPMSEEEEDQLRCQDEAPYLNGVQRLELQQLLEEGQLEERRVDAHPELLVLAYVGELQRTLSFWKEKAPLRPGTLFVLDRNRLAVSPEQPAYAVVQVRDPLHGQLLFEETEGDDEEEDEELDREWMEEPTGKNGSTQDGFQLAPYFRYHVNRKRGSVQLEGLCVDGAREANRSKTEDMREQSRRLDQLIPFPEQQRLLEQLRDSWQGRIPHVDVMDAIYPYPILYWNLDAHRNLKVDGHEIGQKNGREAFFISTLNQNTHVQRLDRRMEMLELVLAEQQMLHRGDLAIAKFNRENPVIHSAMEPERFREPLNQDDD